ncbi:MAG TPA: hypothetical protein DCX12_00735, partial [Chloroflexi bacterium]|nr:hypothetical protein [Chloroflexota bacterium]
MPFLTGWGTRIAAARLRRGVGLRGGSGIGVGLVIAPAGLGLAAPGLGLAGPGTMLTVQVGYTPVDDDLYREIILD